MEYIPFLYFYFSWFLAGSGLSLLLLMLKRFFPFEKRLLFPVALVAGMLFVTLGVRVFWRNGIDALGGGFYAYPPTLAGILAVFGWRRDYRAGWFITLALHLAIGLVALNLYLNKADELAYGRSYWYVNSKYDATAALDHVLEIADELLDAALLYLAVTIPAQVLLFVLIPSIQRLLTKGRAFFSKTVTN
ncbi:MAG: hypothetical protein J0I20_20740 [Chloroflexi bacterium]|nr:hypothetical protein [Chloroflexota bacterium]OJV96610.1 MAG: hypothetical protein BGO39_10165 [Chloroflexi bacterium 54-19]